MAGETVNFEQASAEQSADARRERSTIQFPYGDLGDAENIATAIHQNAGDKCTTEQLAAFVRQSPTSGTFRLRLSTASTFGLTENKGGEVALTELGRRIIDPAQQRKARVEAFLRVPLYSAIFDKYNGFMLPPPKALERDITGLGVSPKQADKARQAFERSAKRAAFFEHGNDKLVLPTRLDAGPAETKPLQDDGRFEERASKIGAGGGGGGDDLHPFIQGLLATLPPAETVWPTAKRKKWLNTAEHIFSLIYLEDDDLSGAATYDDDPNK